MLHGFDTRLKRAMARVFCAVDPEQGNDALLDTDFDAQSLRYIDFWSGRSAAPVMFRDELGLVYSWQRGYAPGARYSEVRSCSECDNSEGGYCRC